ncbi:class I SAM-dependent methyltransferase [Usitatibacter palustris]|uniref:Methyltransferase type 11 domain-containing protein n=1 Tax=Usitatibacter palustris TaxID=2732487 RepID=A0A6M4HB68_9PROT|nr:class I SAM-dependent methyltransferase [Usitatibacter palustris]QJR16452.1 hypothetical protein DSM104440_03287 [Usitatibacter palustris]
MGDYNQLAYLRHLIPKADGPVLEIGSKEYGSTSTFRDHYSDVEYVGVDMAEGPGVDVVADLTKGIGSLKEGYFSLGICCSVLEHVEKPWVFAENLSRLFRPGGKLYMSVPWVWRYHPYPDDYFRFSHKGVMSLFDRFDWSDLYYSSTTPGEFFEITGGGEVPTVDDKLAALVDDGKGVKRKYLPYLMVNMTGTRKTDP